MKASKNELKGLEYFVTAHQPGLNVPLFSIVHEISAKFLTLHRSTIKATDL